MGSTSLKDGGVLRPLAVIGMSFRFPGGSTSDDGFWDMLMSKRCASAEVPPDRFNIDAHYNPDTGRHDTLSCRGGHYIDGRADAFDAGFFGIGAVEANSMDPLHRISLEESFRALENAGLSLQDVAGTKTCVFSGCLSPDYVTIGHKDTYAPNQYNATGSAINMLANRVSWWFDLRGPSVTVDTACSSSLVAFDLACQSIWAGDATMGLVCGANMMLTPESQLYLDNLGMLSKDSRSYSFDHRANGYGRGEGVGVLVVQPLDDAIRGGRTIRAVIRSTSSNQDGKTPGITQPSREAQYRLILDTYAKAGLMMDHTRYFEAHGTGTLLGDPVEAAAIGQAFRTYRSPQDPLYLGSVKSNIGHLEGGSGVAGIIKVILALENGVIAPNANFEHLNPKIDADFLNIKVTADAVPWPYPNLRRASVQSFGFGGSNSHVVLDDALNFMRLRGLRGNHRTEQVPQLDDGLGLPTSATSNGVVADDDDAFPLATVHPRLLVWSTADEGGIARTKDAWKDHQGLLRVSSPAAGMDSLRCKRKGREDLADVAYTLARRSHFPWRAMAVVTSTESLASVADMMSGPTRAAISPQLGLVFTGQGSQWYAMGRELISHYALYKKSLVDASRYLASLGCTWDPLAELMRSETETSVNKVLYSSLLTLLQVALVELLHSFNVQPAAVIGHSSGEIAAAFCAGALSRESAWKIAYYRGLVASLLAKSSATKGAMMAVGMAADKTQSYIDRVTSALGGGKYHLTVACITSPASVTVSGDEAHVDYLRGLLETNKVFCRKLRVEVAFHSSQMQEIADQYLEEITPLNRPDSAAEMDRTGRPAIVSSMTGTWIPPEEMAEPEYWVCNLVSPVLFAGALATMMIRPQPQPPRAESGREKLKIDTLVEVGPHSALQAPVREILRGIDNIDGNVAYVSLLSRGASAIDSLLGAMGRLHCLGHTLALGRVNRDPEEDRAMVTVTTLPPYAFNHSKGYWHESRASRGYRLRQHPVYPHLGAPEADFNPLEAKWRKIIRIDHMPWVEDHKINGTILYPAAGMLVMAIEAAHQLADPGKTVASFIIRNVTLHAALNLPSPNTAAPSVAAVEVNLFMRPRRDHDGKDAGWFDFRLCTYDNNTHTWFENCHGSIQVVYEQAADQECKGTGGRVTTTTGIDNGREERLWRAGLCREYHEVAAACSTTLEIGEFYARLERWGFNYGPAFRHMTAVAADGRGGAAIEVKMFEEEAAHYRNAKHAGVIHPASLDCIFQLIIVAMTNAGTERSVTGIPTHFDRIWLSATGLSDPRTQSVMAYGRARRLGLRQTETSIGVVDASGTRALAMIDGFVATDISRSIDDDADGLQMGGYSTSRSTSATPLCHTIEWKPDPDTFSMSQITSLLDTLVHEKPTAHILEVDAGAGAATDEMMKVLAPSQAEDDDNNNMPPPRFGVFDYTDVDPGHLDVAREKYQQRHCEAKMRFAKLDIEVSPEDQGFETGTYDIVVAAAILHTTADPANALRHCRTLLKPGGKLVLWHPMRSDATTRTPFIMGLTDRWWHCDAETGGQGHPLDETGLRRLLASAGFGTREQTIIIPACANNANHEFSIVMSTAVEPLSAPLQITAEVSIIHGSTGRQREAAHALQQYMVGSARAQYTARVLSLEEATLHHHEKSSSSTSSICVFLLELGQPVWYNIIRETFVQLQKLLATTSSKAIWVQKGESSPSPQFRLVDGVARVLNSERDTAALTYLQLEDDDSSSSNSSSSSSSMLSTRQMAHVVQLCQRLLTSVDVDVDTEYVERGGMLHIPRLVSRSSLNTEIEERLRPRRRITRPWHAEGQVPLRVAVGSPGLLNTLHWVEDTENTPHAPLGDTEVELRVHNVALNFRDLLVALGRVNHAEMGGDVAGVVIRLGRGLTGRQLLRVGDKVAACRMNSFRSLVRCPYTHVARIPDGLSLAEAASLPTTFITAWQCLHERGHLRAGETVLIHSAAGGTGQAAVQIAQHLGAVVIATVGTEDKRALLVERYGIAADRVLSSRDTSFARGVMRLTGGRGVDVVLNSLSGEGLVASWECVAPFGRFIEIGKKDIIASNALPMAPFARNVSFTAYDLSEVLIDRAEQVGAAFQQILALMKQGKMSPAHPLQVFGVGDIEKAFRALQSGKTMGKIVVEFRPNEQVEVLIETKPSFSLDPAAAYIIAGGLGGLGRAICRWSVGRGARTLVLLSRSGGPKAPEAEDLVRQLRSQGVNVITPVCDISDASAVATALTSRASPSMPIIKGCIQASMVLRDAAFESMTYEAWHSSVASKVTGTWNLHEALPRGTLDFFVMLSSVASTCGTRGQANYAAGNAFQNALAHYRVGAGERATALGLGPFFDVGVLADDDSKSNSLRRRFIGATSGVTEAELLALLDYYCDPARPADPANCEPTVMRFAPGVESSGNQLAYVMRKPMFRGIVAAAAASREGTAASHNSNERIDLAHFFATTKPTAAEAARAVSEALATKLAAIMALSRNEVDMAAPIQSFGMDSLVAVEIRNWLSKEVRADVAIFDILEATSVAALGASAVEKSSYFA
ncbi:putative polyketide synthase [Xylaria sp. FL0064]|nr:putative polyketide synthase [Xylaria sp. FL0064]